jgi:pimeloyl-ACP methyl ester carboxylesterase
VTRLALLNTLVYPEFSEAVLQFIKACSTPELREFLTSPDGLAAAMGLGLADESRLNEEMLAGVRAPFEAPESRRALAAAGIGLEPEGFVEIARLLPSLTMPVRVIYGERDRILPDVAETMARVQADLPQAEVTALPDCGQFPGGGAGRDRGAAGPFLRPVRRPGLSAAPRPRRASRLVRLAPR